MWGRLQLTPDRLESKWNPNPLAKPRGATVNTALRNRKRSHWASNYSWSELSNLTALYMKTYFSYVILTKLLLVCCWGTNKCYKAGTCCLSSSAHKHFILTWSQTRKKWKPWALTERKWEYYDFLSQFHFRGASMEKKVLQALKRSGRSNGLDLSWVDQNQLAFDCCL
jgi:hypothetical protein